MTTPDTQYADLHAHTTASDGSAMPEELVQIALDAGLSYLAVTDHDTTAGVGDALRAARGTGLRIVPGVELSAEGRPEQGGKCHLLGLGIRPDYAPLVETLADLSHHRRDRNEQIARRLQTLGIALTLEEVTNEAPPGANVGRPHFAQSLVARGIVPDVKTAFDRYLADSATAYVSRVTLAAPDCIRLIHDAGGLCFLAHPGFLKLATHETIETRVVQLQNFGMDGLEAYYSTYSPAQTAAFLRLAEKRHLIITGGSDFHGATKPHIRVGIIHDGARLPTSLLPPQLLALAV